MSLQKTLKKHVTLGGVGLHSGKLTRLVIKPAGPNHGISFVRTDLDGSPQVAAYYKNVVATQLATTVGRGAVTVGTCEHLLAALHGCGVDNAVVEVGGPEIPIFDGSAAELCKAINAAGVESQLQEKTVLALRRKVEFKLAEKWAVAEPSSRLDVHVSIEWDHPAIGHQEFHYKEGKTAFSELASARTFGFLKEVEALKAAGLARGGSLDNAVVLDDALVLNPGGLRFPDEFVRHKVLDAIGDFKLAGIQLQAYFRLHRSGHDLHNQLLFEIFKDPDNFEIIDGSEREEKGIGRVRAALAHGLAAGL